MRTERKKGRVTIEKKTVNENRNDTISATSPSIATLQQPKKLQWKHHSLFVFGARSAFDRYC